MTPSAPFLLPAVAAFVILAAGGAASGQVTLRGQAEAIAGDVTQVSAGGVVVVVGGVAKTVGWDRVREVHGEHGAEAARELEAFKDLWRARMRLERGDFGAAEPTFEALAVGQRGAQGPTPAVVFEGLTRCRLRRGATIPAVWAWLDWVHARGGEIGTAGDPSATWVGGKLDAAPVMEGRTGLIVSVPPVFVRDAALDAAVGGLGGSAGSEEWGRFAGSDAMAADLAMLYRASARFEAGLPPEVGTIRSTGDAVRLVSELVQARVGDDKQREAARANLRARLEQHEIEPWVECWCRIGIGRSLLREADADVVRQGIIQLLHAPARFARVSAYAASIALAEAAVAMHDLGDEAGAAALKTEMMDRYGRSNAAAWARLREIKGLPAPRPVVPELPPSGKGAASQDGGPTPDGKQGRGG